MTRLLSIDPGTVIMGLAMWEGETLWNARPVVAESIDVEWRIGSMVRIVIDTMWVVGLDAIAIERPFIAKDKPQPELQLLVKRLKQEARKHKWGWYAYHPSTVVASVRSRKLKGWPSKDVLRLGVKMLYGDLDWVDTDSFDQNVVDSIAVGHCHLSKMREQELTEERERAP